MYEGSEFRPCEVCAMAGADTYEGWCVKNVFILSTGRCGSTTFERACSHITNYTASHESRVSVYGRMRLLYPSNHIESDNRLCWFLGRLDRDYGNDAYYVHLTRDVEKVVASFSRRTEDGLIMQAYARGIYLGLKSEPSHIWEEISRDYVDTVNANIALFLKDKTKKLIFELADAESSFHRFWSEIGAHGDYEAAIAEFHTLHNASSASDHLGKPPQRKSNRISIKTLNKMKRVLTGLPRYIREV